MSPIKTSSRVGLALVDDFFKSLSEFFGTSKTMLKHHLYRTAKHGKFCSLKIGFRETEAKVQLLDFQISILVKFTDGSRKE
jgi:hypothetical protein